MNKRFNNYLLEIDEIDKDHIELIDLLTTITDMIISRKNISNKLDIFYSKLDTHFINEEAFMDKIKYPYIAHHKEAHRKTRIDFKNTISRFNESEISNSFFVKKLEDNLFYHIDQHDMQISTFYKNIKKDL